MTALHRYVVVCAAGLKGAAFLEGLLGRGARPEKIYSYDQKDDLSRGFGRIAEMAQCAGVEFINSRHPALAAEDLAFFVGWQYLLADPTRYAVVFHDSLLPRYRGFAPTVTALIRGEREIGVTALLPIGGVDEGPVLAQASAQILYPLKIREALQSQALLMVDLALEIIHKWKTESLRAVPQDATRATYSIWRDQADYDIDWSLSAKELQRFVDAVGYPYAGARTSVGGEPVLVDEAVALDDLCFEIRTPGKIWKLDGDRPVVVCGSGLLRLDRCRKSGGDPYSFHRLRVRLQSTASG